MPRKTPTTNIDTIGTLDLTPENAIPMYLESKQQNEFFIKPPNCDSPGDSLELFLINNHWEREAMEQLQLEMLTHMKRQARVSEGRICRLNKMQMDLRKRFIEVTGFIKECDEKRLNAEKKVKGEVEQQEKYIKYIEQQRESIGILKKFRGQLSNTVEDFAIYERVMDEVVKASNIFVSVKDCMDRCDALMLTQVEITTMEQAKVQEIEEMHKRMTKVVNDAASSVMGLQNDLAELERSYVRLNQNCERWERILTNSKDVLAENEYLKANTLDGIRRMYVMLCTRRFTNPIYQRSEVESQLDYIKDEIELLQEVYEICTGKEPTDMRKKSRSRLKIA